MSTKLELALQYAAEGQPVFPCHYVVDGKCSCGKDCGRHIGKHPMTAHGHKDATTDESMIRNWWTEHPNANIGGAMGNGRIAIDIDPRSGGGENFELLEKQLGKLPTDWTTETGSGGIHYHCTLPSGVTISSRNNYLKGVDIKCDGGYVLLPNSNHASGKPYRWLEKDGDSAPAIPQKWVERLQSQSRKPKADDVELREYLDGDFEEAKALLAQISLESCQDHDRWIAVGMVLHDIDDGDESLAAWDEWSRQASNYQEGECEKRWASFAQGGGRGFGTLEWVVAEDQQAADLAAMPVVDAAEVASEVSDDVSLPLELLNWRGYVGARMKQILASAHFPDAVLAWVASVHELGTAAARKFTDTSKSTPNLGTICLGGSGHGKNHPLACSTNALSSALLAHVLCEDFSSGQAIEDNLIGYPVLLVLDDEAGYRFKAMAQDRSGGLASQVAKYILKLSTSGRKDYITRALTSGVKTSKIKISCPHFGYCGMATPGSLVPWLTADVTRDGLLARMLLFFLGRRGDRNWTPAELQIGADEVDFLRSLYDFLPDNNLERVEMSEDGIEKSASSRKAEADAQWFSQLGITPHFCCVRRSLDAQAYLQSEGNRLDGISSEADKDDDLVKAALYSRAVERANQIALVHAISDLYDVRKEWYELCGDDEPFDTKAYAVNARITKSHIENAVAIVEACIKYTLKEILQRRVENESSRNREQILSILKAANGKWVKHTDALEKSGLSGKVFKEEIQTLNDAGLLAVGKGKKAANGVEPKLYRISKKKKGG